MPRRVFAVYEQELTPISLEDMKHIIDYSGVLLDKVESDEGKAEVGLFALRSFERFVKGTEPPSIDTTIEGMPPVYEDLLGDVLMDSKISQYGGTNHIRDFAFNVLVAQGYPEEDIPRPQARNTLEESVVIR